MPKAPVTTLLKLPAVAPACFGEPERCLECAGCGLRHRCYQRHSDTERVFLLPIDRPPKHQAQWGSSVVPE